MAFRVPQHQAREIAVLRDPTAHPIGHPARSSCPILLSEISEERADVGGQRLGLLERGEMAP